MPPPEEDIDPDGASSAIVEDSDEEEAPASVFVAATASAVAPKVVEPVKGSSPFSLFDYRRVLEEASELHLIESSFAAFAESINLTQKLYAHRYARGHALYDFRHEFTYRKNWNVLI